MVVLAERYPRHGCRMGFPLARKLFGRGYKQSTIVSIDALMQQPQQRPHQRPGSTLVKLLFVMPGQSVRIRC